MMRADGAERAVAALAASQHGAFGTDQAAEKGMTRKARRVRVERGQWLDAARGVLVIAGTPRDMASEAHGRSAVESRRRVALISRGVAWTRRLQGG